MNENLKKLIKEYGDWWHQEAKRLEESRQIAGPLYHYTNAGGLKGIIETRQLWFTGVLHLNDPTELSEGLGVAIDHLENRSQNATIEVIKLVCTRMKYVLENELWRNFGFFVTSFSQNKDDLGQWRAYGNNGKGFAVGFAPRVFQPTTKKPLSPQEAFMVAPVVYCLADLQLEQTKAIDIALSIVERAREFVTHGEELQKFLVEMSVQLAVPILLNSIAYKHGAYKNETETRLILINDIEAIKEIVETRVRGDDLITFVKGELAFEAEDITQIVVGPAAAPEADDAVRFLLMRNGIPPNERIIRSVIPYRP